jgi:hypothetical protein
MIDRMLRAAREGAQVLAWAGKRLALPLTSGAAAAARAVCARRAGDRPAEVPVALAQIHRAFVATRSRAALVAMFLETGRRTEALSSSPSRPGQVPRLRGRALARAAPRPVRPFRPRPARSPIRPVRATGYVDGKPGRAVEVARA